MSGHAPLCVRIACSCCSDGRFILILSRRQFAREVHEMRHWKQSLLPCFVMHNCKLWAEFQGQNWVPATGLFVVFFFFAKTGMPHVEQSRIHVSQGRPGFGQSCLSDKVICVPEFSCRWKPWGLSGVISLGRTRKSTDSSSKDKGKACGRTKNVEITHWNQRKRIANCTEETTGER